MHVTQLLIDGSSLYEQKCQAIDFGLLSPALAMRRLTFDGRVVRDEEGTMIAPRVFADFLSSSGTDLLHIYASEPVPANVITKLTVPWIAPVSQRPGRRLPWSRPRVPRVRVPPEWSVESPEDHPLPEPIDEQYSHSPTTVPAAPPPYILGSYTGTRPGVHDFCVEVMARLTRFRDDVDWLLYDEAPSAAEIDAVTAWVDPAINPDDPDGFVAEAMLRRRVVIGSRTAANIYRLEQGTSGFLAPLRDANEMAHAIAQVLFRPELRGPRLANAEHGLSRFDPAQRARVLSVLYEKVTH